MRTEVPLLTKSDYMAGLQCPKLLYLRKYRRDLADPLTAASEARMHDGLEIGAFAREYFEDGVLIDGVTDDPVAQTARALSTANIIYEAHFVAGGRIVRADILQRTAPSAWRIIEVKSSKAPEEGKKPKPEHLHDVAYQTAVARSWGLNVESAALMLLSRTHRAGLSRPTAREVFDIVDVGDEVERLLPGADVASARLLQVLAGLEEPVVETNTYCSGCSFHSYCHTNQPEHDLVYLPRIKAEQVTELRRQGCKTIPQIPESFKLSAMQVRVRSVVRNNQPFVSEKLRETLEAARYPICFIDFEATKWAIPFLPGTESHQAIPFQWSCHLLETQDSATEHYEFLHTGTGDPRQEFCETLWNRIKNAGSVFVYSSYEATILKGLCRGGFRFSNELAALLEERGIDLLRIVCDNVYLSEFRGSFSIKQVLPAMCPEMSYKDLTIRDGETASVEYKRMTDPGMPRALTEQLAKDLLAYCKRDTEAMVELFRALWAMCGVEIKPLPDDTKHDQLVLGL